MAPRPKSRSRRKKPSRILPIIGILVLAGSVWTILFTGASAITKDNIEAHLQQFSSHIADEAAKAGREGKFSYGDITLEGWGFERRAVVSDVSLGIAEKSLLDTNRWTFSTTKMQVLPDPASASGLVFDFSEPVNVIQNSQLKTIVTFPSPLQYHYFDGYENKVHTVLQMLHFPAQIIMSPAQAAGEPPVKPERIVISYDPNPVFRIRSLPEDKVREATYEFRNVNISADNQPGVSIASLSSNLSEKPGQDGRTEGKYTLMLSDFAVHDHDKAAKAYSLVADLDYHGDQLIVALEGLASGSVSDVKLNQFILATDDFRLMADGTINTASDDPLPFGSITVDIDNLKAFLAGDLVPEQAKHAVGAALQKATGQPVDTLTQTTILVNREKNGVLYVGKVTFDELAASMLADMMKFQSTTPAPASAPPVPEDAKPSAKGSM